MLKRNLVIAICGVMLFAASALGQTYQPGDKVVVISDAELQVSGKGAVDDVWPGLTLTVKDVNDRWLWLSNGKPGWLEQRHVVPLGRQAIDRLTTMIRSDSNNAALYSGRADVWQHWENWTLPLPTTTKRFGSIRSKHSVKTWMPEPICSA